MTTEHHDGFSDPERSGLGRRLADVGTGVDDAGELAHPTRDDIRRRVHALIADLDAR